MRKNDGDEWEDPKSGEGGEACSPVIASDRWSSARQRDPVEL